MNDQTKSDSVEKIAEEMLDFAEVGSHNRSAKTDMKLEEWATRLRELARKYFAIAPVAPPPQPVSDIPPLRSNGTQIMSVGPVCTVGGVERDHLRAGKTFMAIPYHYGDKLGEDDVLLYAPAGHQPVSETAAQGSVLGVPAYADEHVEKMKWAVSREWMDGWNDCRAEIIYLNSAALAAGRKS